MLSGVATASETEKVPKKGCVAEGRLHVLRHESGSEQAGGLSNSVLPRSAPRRGNDEQEYKRYKAGDLFGEPGSQSSRPGAAAF